MFNIPQKRDLYVSSEVTMSALKERQRNPDARPDLASHWFKGLDKATQDKSRLFNQRCLESFATANVGAGSDTVSTGLQSFVYHILRYRPDDWQRIRQEIVEAQKQGRCRDDVVSYDDAVQLPYLQACIKEGLRVFAPIAGKHAFASSKWVWKKKGFEGLLLTY